MKVIVTGAAGFVGACVIAALRARGHQVVACDIGWFSAARTDRAAYVPCDFRQLRSVQLEGVAAIIHLAGFSNDPLGALAPDVTHALNTAATLDLARRARAAGVGAFVFASSCSVYGDSGAAALDEGAPIAPLTPYAQAKTDAETGLLALVTPQFRVAALRGATAFGPSACPRTDLLLNELCALAACGKPLTLTSDGQSWRPFMPVQDFARAFVAALQPPALPTPRPIWNIAPPQMQMTVAQAAQRAARVAGAAPPVLGANAGRDLRSYQVLGSAFSRAYPAFAYSDDFDAAVRETVASFRALPNLAGDLAARRFVRLANLPASATRQARDAL